MNDRKKIQKQQHENLKRLRDKVAKGESLTFAERNVLKIADKRANAKHKAA